MSNFTYRDDGMSECSTAKLQTFPAEAAPADGVSMASVLRSVWAGIRNGTGGTEPGANKSILDAIGFNGTSVLASTAGMLRTAAGTSILLQKTVAASAFVTTGVNLTGPASGSLYIENILLACDAGTITTATNLAVLANNTYGSSVLYEEAIANLAANQVTDLFTASVTKQRSVLENGKHLSFAATGANAAGTGNITITVVFRRITDGASIASA